MVKQRKKRNPEINAQNERLRGVIWQKELVSVAQRATVAS
jgi:hypothetical protein